MTDSLREQLSHETDRAMSNSAYTEQESTTADLIIFAAAKDREGGRYFDDNVKSGHCWRIVSADWQEKAGGWSNGGTTVADYHPRATLICIADALTNLPDGSSVHVCNDIAFIVDHLNASWRDREKADYLNSRGEPFKYREELRQMGRIIIGRGLTVTAGRPKTWRGETLMLQVKEAADLATRNMGQSFSDWGKRG